MTDRLVEDPEPSGITVLALAREHLQREILPLLPPERRGDLRMIDRALGIAIAEGVAGDDAPLARSLTALGFADLGSLVAAIRSGTLDDDPALEAWLRDYVGFRLRRISGDHLPDDRG